MTYSLAFSQSLYIMIIVAAKVKMGQFEFVPAQRISELLGMSPASVAAILRRLHHAGLIETREGANGGVRLAKPPDQISILDIFAAIEQERPLFQTSVLSGVGSEKLSKAKDVINNLLVSTEASVKENLQATTIETLLDTVG